ncbi:MAG: winged helix DNA-binding protein [Alphaproteobacteria bacterium]
MATDNLFYGSPEDSEGRLAVVSIFADRPHVRAVMRDDAEALGFQVSRVESLERLRHDRELSLGQIVLCDCSENDPAQLASLAELDMTAARQACQLIVSTSVVALDAVFACLDQSEVQILVDPSPAERSLALGRTMLRHPQLRVRELSEENRLLLLRLSEQVNQMAARIDKLLPPLTDDGEHEHDSPFWLESPRRPYSGPPEVDGNRRLQRSARPPAPDPRLVRRVIRQRQLRGKFFDPQLFADPAWDILLDLTAARAEHLRVSVTSLCIASGVPPTTALRWIGQLTEAGLLVRVEDESDRRRAFIALTDKAADDMARFFAELGREAGRQV